MYASNMLFPKHFRPNHFYPSPLDKLKSRLVRLTDPSLVVSASFSPTFGWKVTVIVAMGALPLWFIKLTKSRVAPEATTEL